MKHHEDDNDMVTKPDLPKRHERGGSDEKPQRRSTTTVYNLAELAPESMARHPTQVVIVEDDRHKKSTDECINVSVFDAKSLAGGMPAKFSKDENNVNSRPRNNQQAPSSPLRKKVNGIQSIQRDEEVSGSVFHGAGSPCYPRKPAALEGRQMVIVSSPLDETPPEEVLVTEPSQQVTAGIATMHESTQQPEAAVIGTSRDWNDACNEMSDLFKRSKKEDILSSQNPFIERTAVDVVHDEVGQAGAFYVTRDGQRVMREKVNLPAQPLDSFRQRNIESNDHGQEDASPSKRIKAKDTEGAKPFYYSLKFKVLVLVVLVCAIVVGVAVPLSQQGGSDSNNSSASQDLLLRQQLTRSIIQNTTSSQVLDNTTSPQYLAFHWIAKNDQLSPVTSTSSVQAIQKLMIRYALATFYYSLGGDAWSINQGWLNGHQDECTWDFVTCSQNTGAVQSIVIAANNLNGIVPREIQLLSSLHTLDLSNNIALQGIPNELGNLNGLATLNLDGVGLEGSFPSMLFRLTNLVFLNIGSNPLLNGTLPFELYKLSNLQTFLVGQNSFTGSLTSQLHSMTSLQALDLSTNRFLGNWQDITSGLYNLTLIHMYNVGALVGNLEGIQKFHYLSDFSVFQNKLTGTIPTEVGLLTELSVFLVSENQLKGTIPSQLGSLANLTKLGVDGNSALTGSIPQSLCQRATLNEITIGTNIVCNCSSCSHP